MEKEKGEASDAFKRACFNVGIGRELYTKIFIWIDTETALDPSDPKKKRYILKDRFAKWHVSKLKVDEDREKITELEITNKSGAVVFRYQDNKGKKLPQNAAKAKDIDYHAEEPELICKNCGGKIKDVRYKNGAVQTAAEFAEMSGNLCAKCMKEQENGA